MKTLIRLPETREKITKVWAEWWESTREVISVEDAAAKLKGVIKKCTKKDVDVFRSTFQANISKTRNYLEKEEIGTIVYVKGKGYKFAQKGSKEITLFAAKTVRTSVMYASRSIQLFPMVNKKFLPSAIESVFSKASSKVKELAGIKPQLLIDYEKLRKETENGKH